MESKPSGLHFGAYCDPSSVRSFAAHLLQDRGLWIRYARSSRRVLDGSHFEPRAVRRTPHTARLLPNGGA